MAGMLAVETATEACSVAVMLAGRVQQRHEIAPRQHNQLVFRMLEELLPGGDLTGKGIAAIAYGCGPGSFTGLRVAAAVAQGLAYACRLPAVPVSSLAVLAQTALASGSVEADATLLCTLDARLSEVYAAVFRFCDGLAVLQEGPWARAPESLVVAGSSNLQLVGDGASRVAQFPPSLRQRILSQHPELLPRAADMLPLAQDLLARGVSQSALEVAPVYVRDEINWKKLHEQGKSHD